MAPVAFLVLVLGHCAAAHRAPAEPQFQAAEPRIQGNSDATSRILNNDDQGGVYIPNPWANRDIVSITSSRARTLPAAPADDLAPGIEAQDQRSNPALRSKAVYYPHTNDVPDPFPQRYATAAERGQGTWSKELDSRGYTLQCMDDPLGWTDMNGNGCTNYKQFNWCTKRGHQGAGWDVAWGSFRLWARRGTDASQACCACGGGEPGLAANQAETPIERRELAAPMDALRGTNHVPEEAPPMAPEDAIPPEYASFFGDIERASDEPGLMGFSVRYFKALPTDCSVKHSASVLDRALDYGRSASLLANRRLQWAWRHMDTHGSYWVQWTATLQLFQRGTYSFDLDIGFDTQSIFRVDGKVILTAGQCRGARNQSSCEQKGCRWKQSTAVYRGTCAPPKEASLLAGKGVQVPPFSSPPPAPMTPLSPSSSPHAPAPGPYAPFPAPMLQAQPWMPWLTPLPGPPHAWQPAEAVKAKQVPAPAPAPLPSAEGPIVARTFGFMPPLSPHSAPPPLGVTHHFTWAPTPAPTARPPQHRLKDTDDEHYSGFHCIEALVLVTPAARELQLRYSGPDTDFRETVIPGQVLFCDGVIPACPGKGPQTCAKYVPRCSD